MNDTPALVLDPPPDLLAAPALRAVLAALGPARLVGGAVRDALCGQAVSDIDIATPLPPEAVTRLLQAAGLRALPTGLAHGTVTALADGSAFEITTLRRDLATDGRHADVAWTTDWRADAARRDFTINAMSMDANGAVFDYFGGLADLAAGTIRFVGDAAARIAEDYLRILRFFRFQARYGRGAPDTATLAALRQGVPGLAILSPERVWSELKRILAAPSPGPALALMRATGVLAAILPEADDAAGLARLEAAGAPADPLLRLAALIGPGEPARIDSLAERLRFSGAERERLLALLEPALDLEADDDALRRALADAPATLLVERVMRVHGAAGAALGARLLAMQAPHFALAGRDGVALGIPPGPRLGRLLRAARAHWLAGGCRADATAQLALLRQLAAETPGSDA